MDVDGAGAAGVGHAPDEVEQSLSGEDDAGMLEEAGEEIELLARELDQRAGDRHLTGVAPQNDLPCGEHLLPATEPDDAPAVLLLEVLLDETPDRVVILHEEESAPGCLGGHGLRIGAAPARTTTRCPVGGSAGSSRRRRNGPGRSTATP